MFKFIVIVLGIAAIVGLGIVIDSDSRSQPGKDLPPEDLSTAPIHASGRHIVPAYGLQEPRTGAGRVPIGHTRGVLEIRRLRRSDWYRVRGVGSCTAVHQ